MCFIHKIITHIHDEYVDDAENLDIIMPMYNLIEYDNNYSDTSGSLWQSQRDESPEQMLETLTMFLQIIQHLKYKLSIFKTLTDADNRVFKNVKIAVSLKHLSNFWRSLEMPLINLKFILN